MQDCIILMLIVIKVVIFLYFLFQWLVQAISFHQSKVVSWNTNIFHVGANHSHVLFVLELILQIFIHKKLPISRMPIILSEKILINFLHIVSGRITVIRQNLFDQTLWRLHLLNLGIFRRLNPTKAGLIRAFLPVIQNVELSEVLILQVLLDEADVVMGELRIPDQSWRVLDFLHSVQNYLHTQEQDKW